jgi:hypothetical protein
MLPSAYATPAAIVFVIGGLLACFAGYRLFRIVLGINGFIFGALIASQVLPPSNNWALAVTAIVGGVVGAVLMVAAYFVGVALVGAGLGTLAIHFAFMPFHAEPPWWAVVIAAILGALGALAVTRYVIIIGTAFSGAWMLIVGSLALMGNKAAAQAANEGSVWLVYPLDPAPGRWWIWVLWFALAIAGAVVQTMTKGKGQKK